MADKQFVQRQVGGELGDAISVEDAGKELGIEGDVGLQQLSDIGGFSPVAAPSISQGTQEIRDEKKLSEDELILGINGVEDASDEPVSILDSLLKERDNINNLTNEDLASIESAGEDAGAAFNDSIEEARVSRKQTLASNIVRAGERGGFESTQLAGTAAVLPTEGKPGEAFVGAGGKLDALRQTLDRNVSLLISKREQAISAAKAAQRKAIRTGKSEDFKIGLDLVKLANDLKQDAENLNIKKEQLGLQFRAEARLGATAEFNIIKDIKEGEFVTVGGQQFLGIKPSEDEKAFFTGSNIISLMSKLDKGVTQELTDPNTGQTFTLTGLADPATIQATDDRGDVSIINKGTGEVIAKAEGVGKTKAAPVSIQIGAQEKGAKQEIVDNLNSARDPQTNKVSPEAYVSQFTTFLLSNLGDIGAFRASFPASIYLSPEDAALVNEELATAEAGLSTLKSDEDDDEPLFQ